MDRPHWEPRRALVAARHSVVAKVCSAEKAESLLAKGLLLAMEPMHSVSEKAQTGEMLSAAPAASSAELLAFVLARHTQPPGQLRSLIKPSTNV